MEYRLYNKLNCSFFDLIGDKEPDQTKGLGYLLAKSSVAMELLLKLISTLPKEIKELMKMRWVVDCELQQKQQNRQSLRADVVIRFYDKHSPYKAIVIEAKSASKINLAIDSVFNQVEKYRNEFRVLNQFTKENIVLVTLTNITKYESNKRHVISITWQDIRKVFSEYYQTHNTIDSTIIKDYITYINKIQGTMNFYDAEILSIPAGWSIDFVRDPECGIYECPVIGKYKSRGEKHPLYVAFRERGNHGRITHLYKIQDIVSLDLDDNDAIDSLASTLQEGQPLYPQIKNKIEYYKTKHPTYGKGLKWVFIIDRENSIELPFPVEYDSSIRGLATHTYLTLNEVIRKPDPGCNVVKIKMKKDQ